MKRPILLALLLVACSHKPATPEAQVRDLIAKAGDAAGDGDGDALKKMVSKAFHGAGEGEDLDKKAVDSLIGLEMLRYGKVHALTRIVDLRIPSPGHAEVAVVAALAASPIESPAAALNIHADLFHFDLRLAEEEGEWRVTGADWRSAAPEDLVGGP